MAFTRNCFNFVETGTVKFMLKICILQSAFMLVFCNPLWSQVALPPQGDSGSDSSYIETHVSGAKSDVMLPTAFSPNGDGVNDVYHVILDNGVELVSFSIFNRWGELVFQTADPSEGWDGWFRSGIQPVGTYMYFISYRIPEDAILHSKRGTFTLIR